MRGTRAPGSELKDAEPVRQGRGVLRERPAARSSRENATTLKAKTKIRKRPGKPKRFRQAPTREARGEEYLRMAMDVGRMTTWDWNVKTDSILWGGNIFQVFGLQNAKAPQTYAELEALIHPEDRKHARAQLAKARRSPGEFNFEFRVLWPNGTVHWVEAQGQVLTEREGKQIHFLGILMDETDRKELELIFMRTQVELEKRVNARTTELATMMEALKMEAREREQVEKAREELFRMLVTAEEDERRRISRELHDHLGQYLTALGLELNALKETFPEEKETHEKINRLQSLTRNVGLEVHRIAMALRPTSLDDFGLHRTLLNCLQDFGESTGVAVDHHISGLDGVTVPDQMQTTLYRFLQEALNNVLKHSSATRVSFILDVKPDVVLGIVEDNGKGFSMEKHFNYSHLQRRLGLRGMKERITLLGGDFQIESSPGHGTTVFVRIPMASSGNPEGAHEQQ
jgi:signal transduction histidine kinase